MSLLKLLADFPNYPARRVRRLAKQLALLQDVQRVFALNEANVCNGIASDLMDFNLEQAKEYVIVTPETLDTIGPNPAHAAKVRATERVRACRVDEAIRAINELRNWVRQAHVQSTETFEEAVKRAKGIVYGDSFSADRAIERITKENPA